jgi:GT2 family glycosyltransferase
MSEKNTQVALPPVFAVVATRNRGDNVVLTIQSILKNRYPDFTLLLVDQSDNDLTQEAIRPFQTDPRFFYFRTATKGLGISHNLAISRATTEIIAITDDDCEVPSNWLAQIAQAFCANERLGLVFGNVLPAQYDPATGYIPEFKRNEAYLITGLDSDFFRGMGIGACMALRRSAWEAVHGFDQALGPGSPLGSLEDRDLAVRIVLAGYYVYHNPNIQIIHYGFRPNKELSKLSFQDWYGFGSNYAKYLKGGYWSISRYLLRQMWLGQAVRQFLRRLLLERRIRNVTPVVTFWIGFLAGLITPIDHKTGHFVYNNQSLVARYYTLVVKK